MNDWPQIAIAVLIMWRFAISCMQHGRDSSLSSGAAALAVMLEIACAIGYVLILHAGRFW